MTWGSGPWGYTAWGGVDFGLVPEGVFATSERTVQVLLALPPLQQSEIGFGDALNPATWLVHRGAEDFHVMHVKKISSEVFELYTLRKFTGSLLEMSVGAAELLDEDGAAAPAFDVPFLGCKFRPALPPGQQMVDIANQPFPTSGRPGGTIAAGSSGDYRNESGAALLRKLIIRRAVTLPGGFLHLSQYGLGLTVKGPMSSSDLVRLRLEAERQFLQEPEISEVGVSLTLTPDGVLTMLVQAKMSSGQAVTASVAATPEGIQF